MIGHTPTGFLRILRVPLKSGSKDIRGTLTESIDHVALICSLQAQTEEENEKGKLVFICEEETQV